MPIRLPRDVPRVIHALAPDGSRPPLKVRGQPQKIEERRDVEIGGSEALANRCNAEHEELDRKLDRALECTFPASDAFCISSTNSERESDDVRTVREAVGVFARVEDFQSAIDEF
jgi:hypothetical protein